MMSNMQSYYNNTEYRTLRLLWQGRNYTVDLNSGMMPEQIAGLVRRQCGIASGRPALTGLTEETLIDLNWSNIRVMSTSIAYTVVLQPPALQGFYPGGHNPRVGHTSYNPRGDNPNFYPTRGRSTAPGRDPFQDYCSPSFIAASQHGSQRRGAPNLSRGHGRVPTYSPYHRPTGQQTPPSALGRGRAAARPQDPPRRREQTPETKDWWDRSEEPIAKAMRRDNMPCDNEGCHHKPGPVQNVRHTRRECWLPVRCYNCGSLDHFRGQCNTICMTCFQTGHDESCCRRFVPGYRYHDQDRLAEGSSRDAKIKQLRIQESWRRFRDQKRQLKQNAIDAGDPNAASIHLPGREPPHGWEPARLPPFPPDNRRPRSVGQTARPNTGSGQNIPAREQTVEHGLPFSLALRPKPPAQ